MKEIKTRKVKEARYVTDSDMKDHFNEVINKSTEIIDRQFKKIGKCAKGRTYSYTPEQVEKWNSYILAQTEKVKQRLLRTVEPETSFNVGA